MVKNPQTTLTMSNTKLKTNEDKDHEMITDWIDKHKLVINATMGATTAAVLAGTWQFIGAHVLSTMSYNPPQILSVFRGRPWDQSRNMALISGVHIGVCAVIRTCRGKVDMKEGLVAGFTAGYVGAMASGMKGFQAISNAILFSMASCLVSKHNMNNLRKKEEDVMYHNTRGMLSSLGLEQFEKNFRKGMFTDRTLPLLTNSDLQEVKIPAGARRVILDHIQKSDFVRKVADIGRK